MVKKILEEKIKKVLDEIRPSLESHGGNVEFVSFDEKSGNVNLKLQGVCSHCPMSHITLKMGIENELKEKIKEVTKVEAV